jgi:hypothetical protein
VRRARECTLNHHWNDLSEDLTLRTFDLIRDAVLPDFRERVADYLIQYESVLLGETSAEP